MKTKIITIIFLVLSKVGFGQYQQYEQLLSPYLSDSIRSGFFYFNTPNNFQAGTLYQLYRLNTPDLNNNMVLIEQHTDSLAGLTHFKYQQTFMDVPIEGAGCIEHYDRHGSLLFINAKIADSIKSDFKPRFTEKEAIANLISQLREIGHIEFAWESPEWEQQIRIDHADSSATWFPNAELIYAVDTMKNMTLIIDGSRYSLAYKIPITTISPEFTTYFYYVDALNGAILKVRSSHIDVTGDVYGYGNRNLDTKWRGGFIQKYELDAEDNTHNIHTKKFTSYAASWNSMPDTRSSASNWGSTYLTETSTHYHVTNSWDYYLNEFGRIGMDGQGGEIHVKTQLPLENAYYDGSITPNDLVFGFSPTNYDLGLEPSIVGHEFTHGITHYTANLAYEYESGALNESFSDIFGVVIQAQTLDWGSTDWIMGNHIPNTTGFTRSMINPNTRGYHWTGQYDNSGVPIYDLGQPEYYNGNYWCNNCPYTVDYGGVHLNSGVQNKWFQALSAGETGPNVPGIGMNKAAKIAYYALTSILMNSSQYTDSKQATITAAIILFGQCSQEHRSTVDAWNHVGIFASYDCEATSVEEIVDFNDVLVYPNPSNSILFVEMPFVSESPIQFYDINGKLVKELENNELYFHTDISSLENGVYLLHFNIKGQQIIKRIIVQK